MLVLVGLLVFLAGCAPAQRLPDQASMDSPPDSGAIVVVPEGPTPGQRYLVERDGQDEIWFVKDNNGMVEFIDPSTQQTKFLIKLGRCLSFS